MWWWTVALAAEPSLEPEQTSPDPSEPSSPVAAIEVVVTAERRLASAREGVHRHLAEEGYLRLLSIGERSWYLNRALWKPGVMIHEQGFARVRGRRLLPLPLSVPAPEEVELQRLSQPAPGAAASPSARVGRLTFAYQSRGAVEGQRARVIDGVEPWLREMRDARWSLAQGYRSIELRDQLVGIWFDGIGPDGAQITDYRARRAALLDRWLAVADGEAGDWARAEIEAFVDDEVQSSDHPLLPSEIERANATRRSGRPLRPLPARGGAR